MPTGLQVPITVNTRGGAVTITDSAARKQNIILGLKPASSQNPWHQKLTPPEEVIFDIANEITGGMLIAHIYDLFKEQERMGLARLASGADALQLDRSNSKNGEVQIVINYIDLENNESREVRFGPGRR